MVASLIRTSAILCVSANALTINDQSDIPKTTYKRNTQVKVSVPSQSGSAWLSGVVKSAGANKDSYNVEVADLPKDVRVLKEVPASAIKFASSLRAVTLDQKMTKAVAKEIGEKLKPTKGYNCTAHPLLCNAPFSCNTYTSAESLQWFYHGLAPHGQGNPRGVCSMELTRSEETYLSKCLGHRDAAGAVEFRWKDSRTTGEMRHELEGSFCFVEGYCDDTKVTGKSTIADSNALCDERFGRERWTSFASHKAAETDSISMKIPGSQGYSSRQQTTPFVLGQCALGRHHCDVLFCKETYCKTEYFQKKYGHFLKH